MLSSFEWVLKNTHMHKTENLKILGHKHELRKYINNLYVYYIKMIFI